MFLDECDLRVVADDGARPHFVLLSDFRYQARDGTVYTVHAGFESDGSSIPRPFLGVVGYTGLRAGVIHDALVTDSSVSRETADSIFLDALHDCGVDAMTAQAMYRAVASYTASLAGASINDPRYGRG